MNGAFSLEPVLFNQQAMQMKDELAVCNRISEGFGLVLSGDGMLKLIQSRFRALKANGRIEFGEGVLKKLVYAFCDSPFIYPKNYEETLSELQDIFYYFKNESREMLSDDELIEAMRAVFNGKAQGSLEYLAGTSLEGLCRGLRGGTAEELADTYEDEEEDE